MVVVVVVVVVAVVVVVIVALVAVVLTELRFLTIEGRIKIKLSRCSTHQVFDVG
jgi:hypothetical protein